MVNPSGAPLAAVSSTHLLKLHTEGLFVFALFFCLFQKTKFWSVSGERRGGVFFLCCFLEHRFTKALRAVRREDQLSAFPHNNTAHMQNKAVDAQGSPLHSPGALLSPSPLCSSFTPMPQPIRTHAERHREKGREGHGSGAQIKPFSVVKQAFSPFLILSTVSECVPPGRTHSLHL